MHETIIPGDSTDAFYLCWRICKKRSNSITIESDSIIKEKESITKIVDKQIMYGLHYNENMHKKNDMIHDYILPLYKNKTAAELIDIILLIHTHN